MEANIGSRNVNYAISPEPQLRYPHWQLTGLDNINEDAANNSIFGRSAGVDNVVMIVGTKSLHRYSTQDTHIMINTLAQPPSPINMQRRCTFLISQKKR
jgi:hypothetical protein